MSPPSRGISFRARILPLCRLLLPLYLTDLASVDAFVLPGTITTSTRPHSTPPRVVASSQRSPLFYIPGIELSDVTYDDVSTAFDAWEWTNAIGAPAALVAGAVLVTLGESRESTAPRRTDTRRTRFLKLSMRFLLLTSFALEVVSIFTATITGTVLLGQSQHSNVKKMIGYGSPLQLMKFHHEFEMLTTQICFLQGLFNWLAAVAVELVLPRDKETKSARRMNKCLVGWLSSMMIWMLAFYNHHLSFYRDYFSMLVRWAALGFRIYVLGRPIRPMCLLYFPSLLYSAYLTFKAFQSPPDDDEE